MALIEATPEGYRERGHFTPPGVPEKGIGKGWEYPVVADGRLYIHDWGTLWCYDVKAPSGKRCRSRASTDKGEPKLDFAPRHARSTSQPL